MHEALHEHHKVAQHPWQLLLEQALDHLLVLCLGLDQSPEPMLLFCTQHNKGQMLGLVDVGKGLDNVDNAG